MAPYQLVIIQTLIILLQILSDMILVNILQTLNKVLMDSFIVQFEVLGSIQVILQDGVGE